MAEGPNGRLEQTFRRCEMTLAQIEDRFPRAGVPPEIRKRAHSDPETRIPVIEAIVPDRGTFAYMAVIEERNGRDAEPAVLREGRYRDNPFINFRWRRHPRNLWPFPGHEGLARYQNPEQGRGIDAEERFDRGHGHLAGRRRRGAQSGDDQPDAGNHYSQGRRIRRTSAVGLPGRIDLSERIDRTTAGECSPRVVERQTVATEHADHDGDGGPATGRGDGQASGRDLWPSGAELLTPMISRAIRILIRRGEIADLIVDGRTVEFEYRSPLARYQTGQDAGRVMTWIQNMTSLGPEAIRMIDATEAAKYFAKSHGVPQNLIKDRDAAAILGDLADALQSGDLDLEEIVRQAVPVLGPMLENLGLGLKDADPETASPTGLPNNPPDSSSPADPPQFRSGELGDVEARQGWWLDLVRSANPAQTGARGRRGRGPKNRPRLCPVLRRLEAETVLGYLRAMTATGRSDRGRAMRRYVIWKVSAVLFNISKR